MNKQFSDRARKAIELAFQEAHRFNHEYLGTEHILLGIAREESGVGANVLKNLGVELRQLRLEVEKLTKRGSNTASTSKLPLTPRAKRVVESAIEESRALNHDYVGTEHLLLGLLREPDGVAAQVLLRLGISLAEVRREVLSLFGVEVEEEDTVPAQDPVQTQSQAGGFSDRAQKVMALANQEAWRFNHEYVGTEHILLGLVKEGCGVAANVLKNLQVDLRKVRLEVEKHVKNGDIMVMGRLPQTPRAKKVIEFAIEESRAMNHNYVGTEHLLLGLLHEPDGVAAQVLLQLGMTQEETRKEVVNLLAR